MAVLSKDFESGEKDSLNFRTSISIVTLAGSLFATVSFFGCSQSKKPPPLGLILTPKSYYSTEKARALGEMYQPNLEFMVKELVRNPISRKLQFASNIGSAGGIGFYTHSATQTPDERYLEVILALPDVMDSDTDFITKVNQLFSTYGFALLSVLAGDEDILDETDIAGYGLNFSWRTKPDASSGSNTVIERAVIYNLKGDVHRFVTLQINQEELLKNSVIFAIQGTGPAKRIR